MSSNNDSDVEMEQVAAVAVAVAAVAYVINLTAESNIQDQRRTSGDLEPSLIKDKSRKKDKTFPILKPGILSKQFSGKDSRKGSESADGKVMVTDGRPPSFKKSVTFADHIGSNSRTKPARRPEQPPPIAPLVPGIEVARLTTAQKEAEAWEKAEMAKIKEKYAKLNSTILAWEEKKKKKARNKLDKEESGLEKKRAQGLTKFRNAMEYIKEVADGARAQAQSRQRNDELKIKEKANIIRETGKVPRPCFCC